jgi:L-alanine-DL-glutamate epimerase-like enolase superfamily enzyme
VRLEVAVERWPIAGDFRISRGQKTEAEVVVVSVERAGVVGRGEGVPYGRYGETTASVVSAIEATRPQLLAGQIAPLRGAAGNALEAARLDLEAKETGVPVWERLGLAAPGPTELAWTLSIDTPDRMAERAQKSPMRRLKVKLAGDGLDHARLLAIRAARPDARLWLDANEGLDEATLPDLLAKCAALGVELLEQPLPASSDGALARLHHPVPICADESFVDRSTLPALRARYDAVSVKLDKAGGLQEALACVRTARELGFRVVLGCMVSTSLSIAPAMCLASLCDDVDLDGALLLARDREGGPSLSGGVLVPGRLAGWGA